MRLQQNVGVKEPLGKHSRANVVTAAAARRDRLKFIEVAEAFLIGPLLQDWITGIRNLLRHIRNSERNARFPTAKPPVCVYALNPFVAMRDDWVRIFTTNFLAPASREQLEKWLARNQTGAGLIRDGVPSTWKVSNKTGRSSAGADNDVAILQPPERKPIFLAIYYSGSNAQPNEEKTALAEVAQVVAESFRPNDLQSR